MAEDSANLLEVGRTWSTRRKIMGTAAALLGIATAGRAFAQDATPEPGASPEAAGSQEPATPVSASGPLQYLFIQTSSQGAWSAVRGQPGAFFLTLTDPSPQTIVIQDEPTNAAGTMSTAEFFDSIRIDPDDPLQAVISAQTSTGEDVLVVSLLRASYSPTAGELTYVAKTFNGYSDQHGLVPLQQQTGNFTLPPSFGATTVFITNAYCRSTDAGACSFG
jgi:hypothetical protein